MSDTLTSYVDDVWETSIIPTLCDYIRIPNVSVAFDPEWKAHGHMDRAVELIADWCRRREIVGMTVEVREIDGLTPVIVVDVPAFGDGSRHGNDDTVLLYGHLDKQPEMSGWRDDLGPWTPVRDGNKLYGRGGADDGYAAFGTLTAIEAAQREGWSHARCVLLIEASEESGSIHLPQHLQALGDRIGTPSLVVCLDAGCLDDQHLWVTTSLRGLADGVLRVDVLTEGVHSGEASGIVPSSFRILRQLLDRVEDASTGEVTVPELHVQIPADRRAQAAATAAEFPIVDNYPWAGGTQPMDTDATEQRLAITWRPTLSVIGAEGWPPPDRSGNVLRPFTALRLSFRLPPTCDHERALEAVTARLTADPPSNARVTFGDGTSGPGWNAPSFAPWLEDALEATSQAVYGNGFRAFGEGGSIPFMGMLGETFPSAQFVITGVLGPGSNAHGPNEFLDVVNGAKVTASIAHLLRAHAAR
jgi:acetylornithine deacetylase/succinyl-diaminopimelate desuccinylase-like protein